jgi:hypothetical protein
VHISPVSFFFIFVFLSFFAFAVIAMKKPEFESKEGRLSPSLLPINPTSRKTAQRSNLGGS